MSVVPALGKQKQKDHEFKASLSRVEALAHKKNTKVYGLVAVLVFLLFLCCCDKKYFGRSCLSEKGLVLAHSSRLQFVLGVGRGRLRHLDTDVFS